MSHPYHHAISSSRIHGGIPEDYQAVHDWFDRTKAYSTSMFHRVLRHHKEGIADAVGIFGAAIRNSDGAMVPVSVIGEQHCREDFGGLCPGLSDWFDGITVPSFLRPVGNLTHASPLDVCAKRHGGSPVDYASLLAWLRDGSDPSNPRTRIRRYHSGGIFDMEERFGTVVCISGRNVPVRLIGETLVKAEMPTPHVPSVGEWLSHVHRPHWMRQPVRLSRTVEAGSPN